MNSTNRSISVVVSEQDIGLRADVFVYENAPLDSRSKALSLFKNKLVLVNGKVCKASYRVVQGDRFDINFLDQSSHDEYLEPYKIDLNILFEDDDLMVINKPGGLGGTSGGGPCFRYIG